MKLLPILPILIPLFTAIVSLLWMRSRLVQQILGIFGCCALLAVGFLLISCIQQNGILAVQIGNWPAPFGITLMVDLFSAMMVTITGIMGLTVFIYSIVSVDPIRQASGYFPLFHILLMGVGGSFITGDVFNLYVWFEVMMISSFVLLALGGEKPQIEGAVKYVVINLVSSAFFLAGAGILYGSVGTLNMADLALKLGQQTQSALVNSSAMLFLIAFGIKAAVFPLFFWLPASYHTPPAAVSAIFAGLLTKVGVYALIRCFTLFFVTDLSFTLYLILVLSGLTMVTGVLGAVIQTDFRRILSFHIISQIGYMIMGLALYTPLALAASIFYIIHHIVVKTNLFLISGLVNYLKGSYNLKKLGGVYQSHAFLTFLFIIPAFSLAGIPPLSGFFAKFALVKAGLELEQYPIITIALAVSLLTLYSMTKIFVEVFWKEPPRDLERSHKTEPNHSKKSVFIFALPILLLAGITIFFGLGAQFLFELSQKASDQLMHPELYINAVLGVKP